MENWEYFHLSTLLLAVVVANPVNAQMRCGTELIQKGDSSLRVLEACGEPLAGRPDFSADGEWTYNFGSQEFMMRVIITDGAVLRLEQLGRGFLQAQEEARPEAAQ